MSFSFSVEAGSGSDFENPVAIVIYKLATNKAPEYVIVAIEPNTTATNTEAVGAGV